MKKHNRDIPVVTYIITVYMEKTIKQLLNKYEECKKCA